MSCSLPYEFVRLRFFFGQRLGVLELSDEQAYGIAKRRFHNRHLHGAGVVCGLHADRYAPAGEPQTTRLRLTQGAAIDAHGREVVVGYDTCIDVAAWVRAHRSDNADLSDPTQDAAQRLWVTLAYEECPSDPASAPRDPCGCETTGCEHTRVREGFRLQLATISDLPTPDDDEARLVVAAVVVVYDPSGEVVDLAEIDDDPAERHALWSTAALQTALGSQLDTVALQRSLLGGPRIAARLQLDDPSTLSVPVTLARDDQGAELPLLTSDPPAFTLRRLDEVGGTWEAPVVPTATWDPTQSRFVLAFAAPLVEGTFRLIGLASLDAPVVDTARQELSPATLTRWFTLTLDGGTLTLTHPS
ncbi:MAG: hypothetical protein KTR31_00555 [Myxococcales bacterium]|nr:hypothetical protein [Myxococcales bacterium]